MKKNIRILSILFLLSQLMTSISTYSAEGLRSHYASCFQSRGDQKAFNQILGAMRTHLPGMPHFKEFDELLQHVSIEKHFQTYKKVFYDGPIDIFKPYSQIRNPECKKQMFQEIGRSFYRIASYLAEKTIMIGEGDIKQLLKEKDKRSKKFLLDLEALAKGKIVPLHEELLKEYVDFLTLYHKVGLKFLDLTNKSKEDLEEYHTFFYHPLMKAIDFYTIKLNQAYGESLEALTSNNETDFLIHILSPLRDQFFRIILTNKEISPIVSLSLMGNFLKPLTERLVNVIKLKSFVFQNEGLESLQSDPDYQTLIVFSHLHDANLIAEDLNGFHNIDKNLREIFKFIADNKSRYDEIIDFANKDHQTKEGSKNAKIIGEDLVTATLTLKDYAISFFKANQLAKELLKNFEKRGEFAGDRPVDIDFVFTDKSFENIVKILKESQNEKETKSMIDRIQTVSKIENLTDVDLQRSKILADITREETEYDKTVREINALETQAFTKKEKLRDYISNFYNNVRSIHDARGGDSDSKTESFDISLKDGKLDHIIQAKKGQILRFRITGNWSPSCALRKDGFEEAALSNSKVGPLGVDLSYSKGKAQFQDVRNSINSSSYDENSKSFSKCVEAYVDVNNTTSATIGTPGEFIFGSSVKNTTSISAGVRSSTRNCKNRLSGTRNSNDSSYSNTGQQKTSSDAIIHGGYRSINAPYSHFPVGSLLLFELPAGHSDFALAKKVVVLDREFNYIPSDDSTIYLIPNDCKEDGQVSSESLNVSMTIQTPDDQIVQKMVDPMIKAFRQIEKEQASIIKEGIFSSVDLNHAMSQIKKDILVDSKYSKDELQHYSDLFNYAIDTEMSILEITSRVSRLIHERNLRLIQLVALNNNLDDINNVMTLKFRNILFDDSPFVQVADARFFNKTINFLNNYAIPAIKYFDISLYSKLSDFAEDIIKTSMASSLRELNNSLLSFTKNLIDDLDKRQISKVDKTYFKVIISIPKPKEISNEESLREFFKNKDYRFYHTLPLEMAQKIWSGLMSQQDQEIQFSLADIYHNRIKGKLKKTCSYPIIRSMALGFVFKDDDFDDFNDSLSPANMSISNPVPYLLEKEQRFYNIMDNRLTSFSANVFFGESKCLDSFVKDSFDKHQGNRGEGLSPFANFKFDLGKTLPDEEGLELLEEAKELRIYFQLQAKEEAEDLCIF